MSLIKDPNTGKIFNVDEEVDVVTIDDLNERKEALESELSVINKFLDEVATDPAAPAPVETPAPEQPQASITPEVPVNQPTVPEQPTAPQIDVNGQLVPGNADGTISIDTTPETPAPAPVPAPQPSPATPITLTQLN